MDVFKEALRYMGYGKNEPDLIVRESLEKAYEILKKQSTPKSVSNIFDIEVHNSEVRFEGHVIESRNLSKNLRGCGRAVFFAATLGAGADMAIRRFSKTDMPLAVIADAVATAMIEEYCDEICLSFKEQGYHLRPRFSPGYGDFDIKHQKDFMNILMFHKKIGLTVTDSLMLAPSKSVTAIMGIGDKEDNCILEGCEVCTKTDCPYRRD